MLYLELFDKLSLVFSFDNGGIDFLLENHLLVFVLTALGVGIDKDLNVGDNVIVDDDFLIHFYSHMAELFFGMIDSFGELF